MAEGIGKKVYQVPIPVSLMRLVGRLLGRTSLIEQLFGNLEVESSLAGRVLGWKPPVTMKQAMMSLRKVSK